MTAVEISFQKTEKAIPMCQIKNGIRSHMRVMIVLGCLATLSTFLFGCATLDKGQCLNANWQDIGYADGLAGHPISRLEDHQNACLKHGIVPDDTAYEQGRDLGLKEYCIPYNALREGLAGRLYRGVCPVAADRDFRELNTAAYAVYDLRRDIDSTDSQIQNLEAELRKDKTSEKRKKHIREDIRDLDRKIERLRDELRRKEWDLDRLSEELLHRPRSNANDIQQPGIS